MKDSALAHAFRGEMLLRGSHVLDADIYRIAPGLGAHLEHTATFFTVLGAGIALPTVCVAITWHAAAHCLL